MKLLFGSAQGQTVHPNFAIEFLCDTFCAPDGFTKKNGKIYDPAALNPGNTKKLRKRYKIPDPMSPPENTKKLPKKYWQDMNIWKNLPLLSAHVSRNSVYMCALFLVSLSLRVPNDVFQTVFIRFLTSACDRGKPLQRDKACLKTPAFSSILVPSALADADQPLNTPL